MNMYSDDSADFPPSDKAESQRRTLLRAFLDYGPDTVRNNFEKTTLAADTEYWVRTGELEDSGWIAKTGDRKLNNASGKAAYVFEITDAGRDELIS